MKKQPFAQTIYMALSCLILAAICLPSYSHADTLELQNGEILEGLFKGGTQNSIRFSTNGSLKTIPVTDVLALTISRDISVAVPAQEAVQTPVAAPTQDAVSAAPVAVVQKGILAPTGTPLLVRFLDNLDSRQHKVGHRFSVKLESDFAHNGNLIAPIGTVLYGVLVDKKQARVKGKTNLTLELREIQLNGQLRPVTTREYKLVGTKTSGKNSAFKVLAGAALGAIINDDDRAEGAAVGAGVGLGVAAATRGERITIPKETLIEFQLGAPFSL
jgi:hypothetical protein